MRKWMRERMKRRKPSENLSESTGKIGQAIDPTLPSPLVPSYETDEAQSPAPPQKTRHSSRAEPEREEVAAPPPPRARHPREARDGGKNAASGVAEAGNADTPKPTATREPRGVVLLTIGLPGSGKSTWYKRQGVTPLSSDMLRSLLFDNSTEQRYQGLVFSTLRSLLRARLIAKMPSNYVDATNLSPHERRQWIKMARGFGYEVHAVFFDVPLEICLERNQKRDRQVSEEVMRQMAARLKPPTFKEGFSKIVVVRVKGAKNEEPA